MPAFIPSLPSRLAFSRSGQGFPLWWWAVAAVVGLMGLAWAGVPWIVRAQLESKGAELLGRQVTVGQVDFYPWSLRLRLGDLAVAHADGPQEAPQLYIKEVLIDADMSSLWHLAPVLDELTVSGPRVQLRQHGDGRLDVDDLILRFSQPAPAAASPQRFALHNVLLDDGAITVMDDEAGRVHHLTDLRLALPFISNLPAQRDVRVLPHLGFALNGARFDTEAQTLPFSASHQTQAALKVQGLDIQPYLPYLNPWLPVVLRSGLIDLNVQVGFEQTPRPRMTLSGGLDLTRVKVSSRPSGADLSLEGLTLRMGEVRPLDRVARLDALEIKGPVLALQRNADGRLPWMQEGKIASIATKNIAENGVNKAESTVSKPENPWQLSLRQLAVTGGALRWRDASTQPAANLAWQQLNVRARDLAWPLQGPASFEGQVALAGATPPATLRFEGQARAHQVQMKVMLADFALSAASPYLSAWLRPRLDGRLNAASTLDGSLLPGKAPAFKMRVDQLTLDRLRLGAADRPPLFAMDRLAVEGADLDWTQKAVQVKSVVAKAPVGAVERKDTGQWMVEDWLLVPAAVPAAPADGNPAPAVAWRAAIDALSVQGGAVDYADRSGGQPVLLKVQGLDLGVKNLGFPGGKPASVTLGARVAAGPADPGSLAVQGQLGLQPLAFAGQVDARRLPAHALVPYIGAKLRLDLQRADLSYLGAVQLQQSPAGLVVKTQGDLSLDDVRANSMARSGSSAGAAAPARGGLHLGNELFNWKALSVRGVDLQMAPQTRLQIGVKDAVLSDFYARLVIRDDGRLNLQDLVVEDAKASGDGKGGAPAAVADTAGAGPRVSMGPVSLVNGRVYFSDLFIQPSYSADLTELTGRLGGFTSEPAADGKLAPADLALRGRAEGTASLDISGKLHPLARPLALNIQGRVRDLELAPLTPYAVKYAGHGIERGKLSLDVDYEVKPDGHLVASNRLVLNQLSFGDQVEGSTASLPVKLAVALLADRHGVIDLDLPVSGSLNDPQFSLASVIFKVIGNLIAKAVTAPFSLLGKAFSGFSHDAEASSVGFVAGSAQMLPAAREQLAHVAKALIDKPELQLTITGAAHAEAERDALQRERLNAQLRAERRRQAAAQGVAMPTDELDGLSAEQRATLLRDVYRRADIPKPRNLLGIAKDLPLAEIESLLLANLPASAQGAHQLARQRAVAVRDHLLAHQVAASQLFLGAAQTMLAPGESVGKWVPRAELSLALP